MRHNAWNEQQKSVTVVIYTIHGSKLKGSWLWAQRLFIHFHTSKANWLYTQIYIQTTISKTERLFDTKVVSQISHHRKKGKKIKQDFLFVCIDPYLSLLHSCPLLFCSQGCCYKPLCLFTILPAPHNYGISEKRPIPPYIIHNKNIKKRKHKKIKVFSSKQQYGGGGRGRSIKGSCLPLPLPTRDGKPICPSSL